MWLVSLLVRPPRFLRGFGVDRVDLSSRRGDRTTEGGIGRSISKCPGVVRVFFAFYCRGRAVCRADRRRLGVAALGVQ